MKLVWAAHRKVRRRAEAMSEYEESSFRVRVARAIDRIQLLVGAFTSHKRKRKRRHARSIEPSQINSLQTLTWKHNDIKRIAALVCRRCSTKSKEAHRR